MSKINPGDVGMSLSEFMLSEYVNQYVLAEMFDVSQGAIQKMLKKEQAGERNLIVYEDATEEPRRFWILEWKVIHEGHDLFQ